MESSSGDVGSGKKVADLSHLAGRYLTCMLGKEVYGIRIEQIREIIGLMAITPVPGSFNYLKGIINLRDKVIPVVDLHIKFGLDTAVYDEKTCIMVIELHSGGRNVPVGVIVDSVLEVKNFDQGALNPAPSYGVDPMANFVTGVGRLSGSEVVILLDINKALGEDGLGELEQVEGV